MLKPNLSANSNSAHSVLFPVYMNFPLSFFFGYAVELYEILSANNSYIYLDIESFFSYIV